MSLVWHRVHLDETTFGLAAALAARFQDGEYDLVAKDEHNQVASIVLDIESRRNAGTLCEFAVLTKDITAYSSKLLPNNIVDASSLDPDQIVKSARYVLSGLKSGRKMSPDDVFFCSDLHFNHANIIKYCHRPWSSGTREDGEVIVTEDDVTKMNEALVSNWNSVVSKDSIVWCLGDFCLGQNQMQTIPELVARLNGKIRLVLGNHDHHSIKFYYDAGFAKVYDKPVVWNDFYILSHAPLQWIKDGMVFANLHGHVHNQELCHHVTASTYNCCVEVNGYKPVMFSEIKKKMSACKSVAEDGK